MLVYLLVMGNTKHAKSTQQSHLQFTVTMVTKQITKCPLTTTLFTFQHSSQRTACHLIQTQKTSRQQQLICGVCVCAADDWCGRNTFCKFARPRQVLDYTISSMGIQTFATVWAKGKSQEVKALSTHAHSFASQTVLLD